MRIGLIQIGNSQGIRLPKTVIEQAKLTQELQLEVGEGMLIIRSTSKVRDRWEEAARQCHATSQDNLDDWDAATSDFEGHW